MTDEIRSLADEDKVWLQRAESHLLTLLHTHYGNVSLTHSEPDLLIAQRLLDDGVVRKKDILEMQCLGVVLGNVFASNTSMKWARVLNEYGDMLALHSDQIRFTLYPLTMISKRVEESRVVDMPALYRSFKSDLGL